MEGEAEELEEGGEEATVIWEKCIEQSILVDLSEDESLHLSDFENSLALHLSQAESAASETSIRLNGADLSALDITSSDCSSVSSQSKRPEDTQGSVRPVSAGIPNTIQRYEDPGQDTSDEGQEDLPYDGDLGSLYFKQTTAFDRAVNSDGRQSDQQSPEAPGEPEYDAGTPADVADSSVPADHLIPENPATCSSGVPNAVSGKTQAGLTPLGAASSLRCPSDIHLLLLRHLSQEELLQPGRLIEAETLPEVSLLESVDDTVRSSALTHNSAANDLEQPAWLTPLSDSGSPLRTRRTDDVSNQSGLEKDTDRETDNINRASSPEGSGGSSTSSVVVVEEEPIGECSQVQRNPLHRARSLSEMKYGQGQVHYPLPDFSKVAPKVKIPKVSSGPPRPAAQNASVMHRAQSSPGMLDLISRVLEDSIQPVEKPYVFTDEAKSRPELAHRLHAEYNHILPKHAAAENRIDEMKTESNPLPAAELMSSSEFVDRRAEKGPTAEARLLGSVTPPLNVPDSSCQPQAALSDGEEMTCELQGIVNEFSEKVEEFRKSASQMSINTTEQQMMLRSMMEAQDQMERKYIDRKEEHRALEMQNYMGLSRNTGTFDASRLVEGAIFRIGMTLEDIKEIIDRNVREQISPPHSSSTPTSVKETLHVTPLCMSPSPLHQTQSAFFSTTGCNADTQKEEEQEDDREVHEDVRLQLSSEVTTEASLELRRHSGSISRSSRASLQAVAAHIAADEEDGSCALSEAIDHSDILAYLNGRDLTSSWRQHTPSRTHGESDVGDCASLAVQPSSSSDTHPEPGSHSLSGSPLKESPASQRLVSPETDSGFGSSYLNASASGSLQPHLVESGDSHNDALSSSECSCSNLQTAVVAQLSTQSSVQTAASGATAVELWVESTTKVPPIRLTEQSGSKHRAQSHRHHHRSEPALSTGMEAEQRRSPHQSCPCNSEAILALQWEVSKLKKDLREGLVHLPHLAQKMDYLTSKYRQDREERKSTVRIRKHHRSAQSRHSLNPLTTSQVRVDDWISSDMDPSKSKGTDTSDKGSSQFGLQFTDWPVGGGVTSEFQGSVKHGSGTKGSPGIDGKHKPQTATTKSFYLKERWSPFLSADLQKPLLQVSYASSCSLPASYKVKEPPAPHSEHRKRSTQSDTALLPTDVYFKRTPSPLSVSSRRSGRKGKDIDRTLDQAIELARSMKRTTDRMAQRLSADLAKAQHHRKMHSQQPPGGRKHHSF